MMSSLTRPAVSHVRYAYGGLLRSPRQSLQLATLLRLLTVNLELMTLSEGRQRLRGDLINNDLRHNSFLQVTELLGRIIGIHWWMESGDNYRMSP